MAEFLCVVFFCCCIEWNDQLNFQRVTTVLVCKLSSHRMNFVSLRCFVLLSANWIETNELLLVSVVLNGKQTSPKCFFFWSFHISFLPWIISPCTWCVLGQRETIRRLKIPERQSVTAYILFNCQPPTWVCTTWRKTKSEDSPEQNDWGLAVTI